MSTSESSPQNADAGEFDWDKINDDENLELCLIRVPDSVSFTTSYFRLLSTKSSGRR